jgi:NADPH:quinone reductase-like Zn-dependent oxidoreductase
MRAAILEQFGAPLVLKDLARPAPGPGEVLVKIAASGVNPLDIKIRAGKAAHARTVLPAVLGLDLAGVVEQVGTGVTGFEVGDEVYGLTGGVGDLQGSLAQYAAVDARLLAVKPAALTMREAAALPLVFITAWEGLIDRARVRPGHKVHGADVYATTSPAHAETVARLGATPIDRTAMSVTEYVGKHTGGEGFDIVFDTVGGPVLDASFTAVRTYTGHVVSALGWGTHALAPLSFRGATYSGVFTLMPMLTGRHRAHHGEIMREATALADAGSLKPRLDPRTFTLDSVADAHTAVERGTAAGKVVVDIAQAPDGP